VKLGGYNSPVKEDFCTFRIHLAPQRYRTIGKKKWHTYHQVRPVKKNKYLDILKKHPQQVFLAQEKAQVEGFEDEAANDYRHNFGKKGNLITDKLGAV